jgi:hypothetical protein
MHDVIGTHGHFEMERDGRLSGMVLTIGRPRRDGKFPVVYTFAGGPYGRRIRKFYTLEQCEAAIAKLS